MGKNILNDPNFTKDLEVAPLEIPLISASYVLGLKNEFGDLYKDYEKVGTMWVNKKLPSKYLTDDDMAYFRSVLSTRYLYFLNLLSNARRSMHKNREFTADIDDVLSAIEKSHRRDLVLKDALQAGKLAYDEVYKTEVLDHYIDSNDDSSTAGINGWKNANTAYEKAMIDYLMQYLKNNPETDGYPLFDDDTYETIHDTFQDSNLNIDTGVAYSRAIPASILGGLYGIKGLSSLSNAGKIWLAANHPTTYAAAQLGSGALQSKWAWDGAKGLWKNGKSAYSNFKLGNYVDSTIDGVSAVLDGLMVYGGPHGLRLIDKGSQSLGKIGFAKSLDKLTNSTLSRAGKVGFPNFSLPNWEDKAKKSIVLDNMFNTKKYKPMLFNLGLGVGSEIKYAKEQEE